MSTLRVTQLVAALRAGDRRALAKAITLVESTRIDEHESAGALMAELGQSSAPSFRIGVTGVPGAGKSTLIDVLGARAVAAGARVAVLAIDPSSQHSGGSVLGDKTRMTRLSAEARAFIRPSPTLGVLGGTARRTREAMLLCEAAGYDALFVETVGVGQSEERVASMVDCVLLVLLAGAGDDISTMKRGLLEAADIITFNKADGENAAQVERDAASLSASLSISRGSHVPPVTTLSALLDSGVDDLWSRLSSYRAEAELRGSFERRRAEQRTAWFETALDEGLRELFSRRPDLAAARAAAQQSVSAGDCSPPEAARRLLAELIPVAHE